MRKTAAIIAVLFFFISNADAKKIQGIIITHTDTLKIKLRVPVSFFGGDINFSSLQNRIRYIDENGKKKRIRASDAKEIRFSYDGEDIRMISKNVPSTIVGLFASSHVFLRLREDGRLKLYTYYSKTNTQSYNATTGMTSGGVNTREIDLLQKGDGAIKDPNFFKFRKDMIQYLGDCPDLVELLEAKEFRRRDIYTMVLYYNSKCI